MQFVKINLMKLVKFNKKVYPRIIFFLNKDLDKQVCYRFLDHQKGGVDFGKSIIRIHPKLIQAKGFPDKEKKQMIIGQYVDSFYETHQNQLESARTELKKRWGLIVQPFFKIVDKIFDHPWPKGLYFTRNKLVYIAYLSIFPCQPRFLENKTFQVFYLNKEDLLTTAHELLHFLFYDYFEKNFSEISPTEEKVWVLSEVLNILILNLPEFYALFGDSSRHSYPQHISIIENLKPEWEKRKDLNSFLKSSLGVIEKVMAKSD